MKKERLLPLIALIFLGSCGFKDSPRPITTKDLGLFPIEEVSVYYAGNDLIFQWQIPSKSDKFSVISSKIIRISVPKLCLGCKIITEDFAEIAGNNEKKITYLKEGLTAKVSGNQSLARLEIKNYNPAAAETFYLFYLTDKGESEYSKPLNPVKSQTLPKPEIEIQIVGKDKETFKLRITPKNQFLNTPNLIYKNTVLHIADKNKTTLKKFQEVKNTNYYFETSQPVIFFYFIDDFGNHSEPAEINLTDLL